MQLLRTKMSIAMHVFVYHDHNWHELKARNAKQTHTKKSRMLESIVQCLRLGTGTDRSGVTRSRCSVIKCRNRSLSVRMSHAVFLILLMTACICSPPCSPWSSIPKPQVSIHAVTWFSRKCCFGMIQVLGNWHERNPCILVSLSLRSGCLLVTQACHALLLHVHQNMPCLGVKI